MAPPGRILTGRLPWEVARFGIPLALGMALQAAFNVVDALLIAELPPEEAGPALGALGISDQLAALGTITSYGISTATAAFLSQQRGAGDEEGLRKTAWQSILLVGFLSLAFGVLGLVFAEPIVHELIGAKGQVADVTVRYLRVIVGGSFTIFFLLQLTTMQRALGSAKTPAALLVLGNVLNLVLAIVLIFGPGPAPGFLAWGGVIARALHVPRMGMLGAAWATLFARAAVLVPCALVLERKHGIVIPKTGSRGIDSAEIRRILALAWPTSAQFVLRIVAMLVTSSLVARAFTTESEQSATTAMGLVFRLDTMALFVAMGWGSAAHTFVGQNLGAGKGARAKASGWVTAGYDALTNVGLWALVASFGEAILRLFDEDPAPLRLAVLYLTIVAPSYVALGIGVVLGNAMSGAGATRTTLAIDVGTLLGFQFPVSVLAVAVWHVPIDVLFQCVAATNVVSALSYAIVYARGSWQGAMDRH